MPPNRSKLLRQRLLRGHAAAGICCSLLLYLSIYFGLFAIFLPYLQVWEKPSRAFPAADVTRIDYAPLLASVLADPDFPRDRILIKLPGFKGDPAVKISHQFTAETVFNPVTGKRLQDEGASSNLAGFLNGLHYGKPLRLPGFFLFGFMSVAALFAVLGGLLLIILLTYKKPGRTQQSVFSYWHRTLLLWATPLFLLVVISGSAMCLSFFGSGPMTSIVTKGEHSNIQPVIGPVLFPEAARIAPSREPTPMQPIRDLISAAQKANPNVTFEQLTLENWGDVTATIKLEGYDPYHPFLNGVVNKPSIVLNGHDGHLLHQNDVLERPWSALLTDVFLAIHLLFGVNIIVRLVFFLIMLACCLAIAFGVMLWLEKQARQFKDIIPFYHWLGKLALAVMIGVVPATGVLLTLQWLLPFDLPDRLVWQQGLFYDAWLATLLWAHYRINSYTAARELLSLGGVLFSVAGLLHCLRPGCAPFTLLQSGLTHLLVVDIGLILAGVLLVLLARKLPADRAEAKQYWIGKQQRTSHV